MIVVDLLATNMCAGAGVDPSQAGLEAAMVPPAPTEIASTMPAAVYIIVPVPG